MHIYSQKEFKLPDSWYKDAVDASELDVDLEAEVGEGLGGGTEHIPHLHTLCGHSQ